MKNKNKKNLISLKLFNISDLKKTNYLQWLKDKEVVKYLYRKELLSSIKEKNIAKILNNKEFKRKKFGKFECYLFQSSALIKKLTKILKKNEYYLIK